MVPVPCGSRKYSKAMTDAVHSGAVTKPTFRSLFVHFLWLLFSCWLLPLNSSLRQSCDFTPAVLMSTSQKCPFGKISCFDRMLQHLPGCFTGALPGKFHRYWQHRSWNQKYGIWVHSSPNGSAFASQLQEALRLFVFPCSGSCNVFQFFCHSSANNYAVCKQHCAGYVSNVSCLLHPDQCQSSVSAPLPS